MRTNIFIIGPMGSGKTTIGKRLARELGMDFYDSDLEVENRTGVSIPWIFDVEGEGGFRRREQEVIDVLTQMSGIVLATGGGVILDPRNRAHLSSRGLVIYLQVSIDNQITRTQQTRTRPLLSDASDLQKVFTDLKKTREPLYEEIADIIVDTDQGSLTEIIQSILSQIRK